MPRGKNNRGRWTKEEHDRFLIGLANVGEEWSLVANYVTTRSVLQIRTHAQKYLRKMKQGLPFPEEPYKSTQDGQKSGDEKSGDEDEDENDDDAKRKDKDDNDDEIDVDVSYPGDATATATGEAQSLAHLLPDPRHAVPTAAAAAAVAAAAAAEAAVAPPFEGYGFGNGSICDGNGVSGGGGDGGGGGGGGSSVHGGIGTPSWAPAGAVAPPPLVNPHAACLSHGFDGPSNGARGFGFLGPQQQLQQLQQPQQPHLLSTLEGDSTNRSFSPTNDDVAPFSNWPVAGLHEPGPGHPSAAGGVFDNNGAIFDGSGGNGNNAEAAAAAAAPYYTWQGYDANEWGLL